MSQAVLQHVFVVFGGELKHVGSTEFKEGSRLHMVGLFQNAEEARQAWSAAARATIDDAHMRYFMIDVGDRLDPHQHG